MDIEHTSIHPITILFSSIFGYIAVERDFSGPKIGYKCWISVVPTPGTPTYQQNEGAMSTSLVLHLSLILVNGTEMQHQTQPHLFLRRCACVKKRRGTRARWSVCVPWLKPPYQSDIDGLS